MIHHGRLGIRLTCANTDRINGWAEILQRLGDPDADVRPTMLSGCRTVESSLNYIEGTRALEAGDYDKAISHLEKAVQLDPALSRNHNNLAAAYLGRGRVREAWPHVRKAVILQPRNTTAHGTFRHCFKRLIDMGLVKEAFPEATVVENLGQPDSTLKKGDTVQWQYGMVALYFRDGRVAGFREMEPRL